MLSGLSFTEAGRRHESPEAEAKVCVTAAQQGVGVHMPLKSPGDGGE